MVVLRDLNRVTIKLGTKQSSTNICALLTLGVFLYNKCILTSPSVSSMGTQHCCQNLAFGSVLFTS